MSVIAKTARDRLLAQLEERYGAVRGVLAGRDLLSPGEGAKRRPWPHPELLTRIDGSALRLVLGDFETILRELKRIAK